MNLISFVKVNLSTASIRSKGSSESLILKTGSTQPRNGEETQHSTQQTYPACQGNANIPGSGSVPTKKLVTKDAWSKLHFSKKSSTSRSKSSHSRNILDTQRFLYQLDYHLQLASFTCITCIGNRYGWSWGVVVGDTVRVVVCRIFRCHSSSMSLMELYVLADYRWRRRRSFGGPHSEYQRVTGKGEGDSKQRSQ